MRRRFVSGNECVRITLFGEYSSRLGDESVLCITTCVRFRNGWSEACHPR